MVNMYMDNFFINVHKHLWRYLPLGDPLFIIKWKVVCCFMQQHWRYKHTFTSNPILHQHDAIRRRYLEGYKEICTSITIKFCLK